MPGPGKAGLGTLVSHKCQSCELCHAIQKINVRCFRKQNWNIEFSGCIGSRHSTYLRLVMPADDLLHSMNVCAITTRRPTLDFPFSDLCTIFINLLQFYKEKGAHGVQYRYPRV